MKDFDFLFNETTPGDINKKIAERIRAIRKRRKLSQKELGEKSGVSLGSVKRFEQSGEISLLSLTKIAIAFEIDDEMKNLFTDVPFQSIEEIKNAKD